MKVSRPVQTEWDLTCLLQFRLSLKNNNDSSVTILILLVS